MTTEQLATTLDEAKALVITNQQAIEQQQAKILEHETALSACQKRVQELTKELCKQIGVPYVAPKTKTTKSSTNTTGKTRTLTPEAIEHIRQGQRDRWAKHNQQKSDSTSAATTN